MAGIKRGYTGCYEIVMNGERMLVTDKILKRLKKGEFILLPSHPLHEKKEISEDGMEVK